MKFREKCEKFLTGEMLEKALQTGENADVISDLGCDSLEAVEMQMDAEIAFRCTLLQDLPMSFTLKELFTAIEKATQAQTAPA